MAVEDDAQARRLEEVQRLQRLLDHAPAFMAVVGRDMRFYLANRAYCEMIGRDDIVGRSAEEVFPPAFHPGSMDRVREVMETGEPMSAAAAPFRLPEQAGRPARDLILDFVVRPIAEDGQVIAALIAGNDVTERHRAEALLRESEARFRVIADSAPVPIWVTRPDRTRGFVNKAYMDFVGLDYPAALEFDWRSILHPDDHDRIVAESVAGEASLRPFSLEARYRSGDEWRWLRSTSQPRRGADGGPDGFIGVAHDVTAAKQAEAALRELNETLERRVEERTADLQSALAQLRQEVAERERAEEALRQAQKMEAVGQLTGGIAHDFNNLLTPVIGGLEMVSGRIDDPRLKRLAEGALESARRGAKLATQLLAFSRLQRLAMAPVAVNAVIEGMDRMLHPAVGPGIEIRRRLDPEAGHALCDANQLENAILNLALNARDAMPDGGRLTIVTSREKEPGDSEIAAGDYVCIAVEDEGSGMPSDIVSRAMEPFFSTKPVGKGTGLGLAQVYGIARQSGGTVRIHSGEGRGTAVHILLPSVAPGGEAGLPSRVLPSEPDRPSASIVVVDDDPEVRAFLTDALAELGHRVTAFDGADALLGDLDTLQADLVLLDFAMPGMNGAELAERIRSTHPDQAIAFLTGYAETEQLSAAAGGGLPVLRKPFSLAELADLVAATASS